MKKKRGVREGIVLIKRYSKAKQPNTMSYPIQNTGLDKPGINQLGLTMDSI